MPDPVETPRRNLTGAIVPALAAAVLAALGAILLVGRDNQPASEAALSNCILDGADAVGGPIDLVDSNGARLTQADFAAAPSVIYFGFAHCPDVCPLTMYALAEALAEPNGYDVQPVLISLDPERDTPEVIGQYAATNGFPPGLVGLTGSRAQVDAAKEAFRVYSTRTPIEGGAPGDYTVDHSSMLYVMDRDWRTVAIVSTVTRERPEDPASPLVAVPPGDIAACIARGLERGAPASAG